METDSRPLEITILTIATGKYWRYFLQMLKEFDSLLPGDYRYQVIVYEDTNEEIAKGDIPPRCELTRLKSSYGTEWKLITLKRYAEIHKADKSILGRRFLWLDADTAWSNPFDITLLNRDLRLTKHPDYQIGLFTSRSQKVFSFFERLKIIVSAYKALQLRTGGWSNCPNAAFYVPKNRRRNYAHAAIWGGPTETVLSMCRELAARVEIDLAAGEFGAWMDEEYINWWASFREFKWFPKNIEGYARFAATPRNRSIFLSLDKNSMDLHPHSGKRFLK